MQIPWLCLFSIRLDEVTLATQGQVAEEVPSHDFQQQSPKNQEMGANVSKGNPRDPNQSISQEGFKVSFPKSGKIFLKKSLISED